MTKTPISAMAFYHPHGLVPAYEQASMFASPDGRIATLPDILEARLSSDPYDTAWTNYVTTATAEYYGQSPAGTPLIVVAHGVGPMATLAGIQDVYSFEFRDKTRSRRGGRISRKVFNDLINGKLGDVSVVDFEEALRGYQFPFGGRTPEELLANPLWVARLGGPELAERYVTRHAGYALVDLLGQQNSVAQGPNPQPGNILSMRESNNAPYTHVVTVGRDYRYLPREVEDDLAIGHLLAIGQLTNMSQAGNGIRTHLQSDISPHDWTDGVRLVGLRSGGKAGKIHPGFSSDRAIRSARSLLWQADAGPAASADGFHTLIQIDGEWFTQHPKSGEALDSGQPRHAIVEIAPVGDLCRRSVTSGGYHGFLRYALADIQRVAPAGANAYCMVGTAGYDGRQHHFAVQHYRVTVDRSRRLPTTEEIYRDYELLMKVALAGKQAA